MHLAILCSPVPGHLQPLASIGRSLIARGHRVTVFNLEDLREESLRLGMQFQALGAAQFPAGTWSRHWTPIAKATGPSVLLHTVRAHRLIAEMMCAHAPALLAAAGVDALLVDSMQFQGAAIAARIQRPFISVDCTVSLAPDRTGRTPPPFRGSAPTARLWERGLNRLGNRAVGLLSAPVLAAANRWNRRWNGRRYGSIEETFSKLLHLSPIPVGFDFPGGEAASRLVRCGPFLERGRPEPAFDWGRLDGRPLVYASLGTLQNRLPRLYETLGAAAKLTPAQWVVSFGAWRVPGVSARMPASVICGDYLPQLALLERAQVCVTHAGANTTLEALAQGVPLVAIPIGNDQPAIAARLRHSSAGRALALRTLTAERLAAAVNDVLTTDRFRLAARGLQTEIAALGGARFAAEQVGKALGATRLERGAA